MTTGEVLITLSLDKNKTKQFVIEDSIAYKYDGLMLKDNFTGDVSKIYFGDYNKILNLLKWLKRLKKDHLITYDSDQGFKIIIGRKT